MNTKAPKDVAIEWFTRVWKQNSKEAIYELIHQNAALHKDGDVSFTGPEGVILFQNKILSIFSDLSLEILHAVGDEQQACVHWKVSAKHTGDFGSLAPTYQTAEFTGTSFMIVKDGKIIECWDSWDPGFVATSLALKKAEQDAAANP